MMLFFADIFPRHRMFQKTSDVFWQGKCCLFQMHFVEQGVFQTSDVWQTSDV